MDKVERLTNIVALLLTTRRPLTLDEIADEVGGYPERGESRRAAFERDKKTLRAEGVPLEVVPQSDGGSAYRIDPDAYYLPALDLTDDERVALNLAVAAVNIDNDSGRDALWKLGEGASSGPSLAALPTDDGLIDLFDAWRRRAPAFFDYRGERREVHVWGVAFRNGRWYVSGWDAGRQHERLFRVDRIDGAVVVGDDGTATPTPSGFDLAGALPGRQFNMYPQDDLEEVLVDVDAGWARGAINDLGEDFVVERRDDGSIRVRLHITSRDGFRSWLYGYLDHAVVVSPPEVVADFVAHLEELARG
ncbi:MAG TPA: WYL domain-containing transcriptional regulator [Acidimicrobiales bacterium]|nr:WYL domain-containing transcriptional regulator [Acidimicrobiales bacterium]